MTTSTDPIGNVTRAGYGSLDRLATKTLPAHAAWATPGVVTIATAAGDLVKKVLDPRDVATVYTVNGLGRVKRVGGSKAGNSTSIFSGICTTNESI